MDIRSLLSLLTVAGLLATTAAGAYMQHPEEGLELASTEVSVPSREGSFLVRPCRECQFLRLQITAETRFFIDAAQVTQAELRRHLASKRNPLYVYYTKESSHVTRIVLDRV